MNRVPPYRRCQDDRVEFYSITDDRIPRRLRLSRIRRAIDPKCPFAFHVLRFSNDFPASDLTCRHRQGVEQRYLGDAMSARLAAKQLRRWRDHQKRIGAL